jgi:hypothetical protein
VVITSVIVCSVAADRRRCRRPPPSFARAADPAGRQALGVAWQAHTRLAVLEDRVRNLEGQTAPPTRRGGVA